MPPPLRPRPQGQAGPARWPHRHPTREPSLCPPCPGSSLARQLSRCKADVPGPAVKVDPPCLNLGSAQPASTAPRALQEGPDPGGGGGAGAGRLPPHPQFQGRQEMETKGENIAGRLPSSREESSPRTARAQGCAQGCAQRADPSLQSGEPQPGPAPAPTRALPAPSVHSPPGQAGPEAQRERGGGAGPPGTPVRCPPGTRGRLAPGRGAEEGPQACAPSPRGPFRGGGPDELMGAGQAPPPAPSRVVPGTAAGDAAPGHARPPVPGTERSEPRAPYPGAPPGRGAGPRHAEVPAARGFGGPGRPPPAPGAHRWLRNSAAARAPRGA